MVLQIPDNVISKLYRNKDVETVSTLRKNQQITEMRSFIAENGMAVLVALSKFLRNSQFVLLGDNHSSSVETNAMRNSVTKSLERLKIEGLTYLALELPANLQGLINELDCSTPSSRILAVGKLIEVIPLELIEMLIEAKRVGLNILCIDDSDPNLHNGPLANTAYAQNTRDETMFQVLSANVKPTDKVLIFIGSAHVHKKSVESYHDGRVMRLGTRLVEQYENQSVISIRHVLSTSYFDASLGFRTDAVKARETFTGTNKMMIIPDKGPLKGDPRVSAADYIIFYDGKD